MNKPKDKSVASGIVTTRPRQPLTLPSGIRPLHNKVLIQRKDGADKFGSILIPATAKEIPSEGKVLAVGKACLDVKPGDSVLFGKYAGTEVKLHETGGLAIMCTEDDILGVIEA